MLAQWEGTRSRRGEADLDNAAGAFPAQSAAASAVGSSLFSLSAASAAAKAKVAVAAEEGEDVKAVDAVGVEEVEARKIADDGDGDANLEGSRTSRSAATATTSASHTEAGGRAGSRRASAPDVTSPTFEWHPTVHPRKPIVFSPPITSPPQPSQYVYPSDDHLGCTSSAGGGVGGASHGKSSRRVSIDAGVLMFSPPQGFNNSGTLYHGSASASLESVNSQKQQQQPIVLHLPCGMTLPQELQAVAHAAAVPSYPTAGHGPSAKQHHPVAASAPVTVTATTTSQYTMKEGGVAAASQRRAVLKADVIVQRAHVKDAVQLMSPTGVAGPEVQVKHCSHGPGTPCTGNHGQASPMTSPQLKVSDLMENFQG